jgi:hypothetical protein
MFITLVLRFSDLLMRELNPRYEVEFKSFSPPGVFHQGSSADGVKHYSIITLQSFELFLLLVASMVHLC